VVAPVFIARPAGPSIERAGVGEGQMPLAGCARSAPPLDLTFITHGHAERRYKDTAAPL